MTRMPDSKELESDVANLLSEIGLNGKLTKASGSVRRDGDVHGSDIIMAECKYKSTEGFSISRKDFLKAIVQARRLGMCPVFITRNMHGETVVSMSLDDWKRWMRKALEGEQNE